MKIHIRGVSAVLSDLESLRGSFMKEASEALAVSLRDVQERARAEHRFTTRTGLAERSIRTAEARKGQTLSGTVYTALDYGVYLHEGTKPHVIEPRRKKALRWTDGGRFVFARRVKHPGTKADPYIYDALDAEEPVIVSRFEALAERMKL